MLASLSMQKTFRIVAKGPSFSPDEVLQALTDCSRVSSPSLTALSVLSKRTSASADQYFPPQIVEALSLFGKIGYSEASSLFEFFVSRKDDVLNEASPKRLVTLIEAFANLHLPLFHEAVWPAIRAELIRVLPQLKRGITAVLKSLASLGCTDTELVNGLLTQAECLYTTQEIEKEFFAHAIEAASRVEGMSDSVKRAIACISHELSEVEKSAITAARLRVGLDAVEPSIDKKDRYSAARVIGSMSRRGLIASPSTQKIITEFVEDALTDNDFCHKMMPYTVLNAVLLSDSDEFLKLVVSRLAGPHADRLSADKLLCLLRAARILNMTGESVNRLESLITETARQLSVREARLLWDVLPGVVPASALPPLIPRGQESGILEIESVGPYNLYRKKDNELELLVPSYQMLRPGSSVVRRDFELKSRAIAKAIGDSKLVFSNSFSSP